MMTFLNYINITKEFFQIGLFSFGGGYATIPFLYNLTLHYNWFSAPELAQIIAIASITPGPVGINAATYAGMKAGGIPAALIATTSEVLPALIIGILVSKLLKLYSENFYVKSALWALKPASCALLFYVAIKLFIQNVVNSSNILISSVLFCIFITISFLKSKDPLWYIAILSAAGIILVKFSVI